MEQYKTENYFVSFNDKENTIYMRDLTDIYNETSAYNKNKREYKRFKNDIIAAIDAGDRTSFNIWRDVANTHYKLKMHIYCAMD